MIFHKKDKDDPWQIAAARFCVKNSEEGFTLEGLQKYIQNNYDVDDAHVRQFITEELQLPSGRQFSRTGAGPEGKWVPPMDLVSMVTDYEELKEVRESNKKTTYIAIGSLVIAILVGVGQIVVQVLYR